MKLPEVSKSQRELGICHRDTHRGSGTVKISGLRLGANLGGRGPASDTAGRLFVLMKERETWEGWTWQC